jgi:general L-amino acid transport system permease protein
MTQNNNSFVRDKMEVALAPPISEAGITGWMKKNLFSSPFNTVLTLIGAYLIYLIVPPLLEFSFFDAVWSGTDRNACTTEQQGGALPNGWHAACWPYIGAYMQFFTFGRYPDAELWRPIFLFVLFFAGLIPLMMPTAPYKRFNMIFMLLVYPVLAFILLGGGNVKLNGFLLPESIMAPSEFKFWVDFAILTAVVLGIVLLMQILTKTDPILPLLVALGIMVVIGLVMFFMSADFGLHEVETDNWGGLLLTLVIAVTGIAASLPIGIVLALGRRSEMPTVRLLSVIFIEFWRGVPLITVLFMSSVMLPLFLPEGVNFDKLLRALIGVGLFSAAYMAEVVRGGLQAIPKGQFEGAMAVGLSYWQSMRMIILPQAIKIVIPGIVNTFIGLFKDTTLVSVIGLFDLLGAINNSHTDSSWATPVMALTSYLFCAVIYFVFCFAMARYSLFMERQLDTGHKN